jgi:MYXO-CTERM domain-containing protein
MTFAKLIAAAACAASLVSMAGLARAQECPIADIGKTCSTGTCITATCTDTSADGAVVVRDCAACVSLPPNSCPTQDVGKPCGDGGTCRALGGGMGGGAVGAGDAGLVGPSQDITYALGMCLVDVPGQDEGGTLGTKRGDAAAQVNADDGATHAPAESAAPAATEESGGCATSPKPSAGWGGALLALLAALALMRRRAA